jgi:hypothetical protein
VLLFGFCDVFDLCDDVKDPSKICTADEKEARDEYAMIDVSSVMRRTFVVIQKYICEV